MSTEKKIDKKLLVTDSYAIPNTERKASNFELNFLKLGVHILHLMVGDRFESNGSTFNYVPCSASPNQNKGKYYRYQGRQNSISAFKYKKDVLRADNIEQIEDKFLYVDGTGHEHRNQIWEVKYAYKIELPKAENLICLSIELETYGKKQWEFKTVELEIERETKENYFLKKSHPITHHSQIPKSELNNVRIRYNASHVLCKMEHYNEQELALFKAVEQHQLDKIQSGHDIIAKETENLSKFQELKTKQGY